MKNITPLTTPFAGLRLSALLTAGVALALGGCVSEPDSHVVSAPPPSAPPVATAPVAVVQTPAQSGTGSPGTTQTVVVTQAHPAAQTEPVLEQPSSRHVWIPGYWTYRDSRYVWIAGRWEVPPRSGAMWVAPRWEREGTGYRYYEGYWN